MASRIIEADRAALGNEIHDGLLPLIFAASAGLSGIRRQLPDVDHQRLDQIESWLDQAMRLGRQILTGAYPPELSDSTWTQAIVDVTERFFGDADIMFDWKLKPAVANVPPPVALACYRIVFEAIRNATRHGGATIVRIDANPGPDVHRVTVTDNGVGFDPDAVPSGHFGIQSMRARAELIGGRLMIRSKAGGPTTIEMTFPSAG